MLLPFHSLCASCGGLDAARAYCETRCLANGANGFEIVSAIGQIATSPHLHVTCARCGYVWLERCLGLPMMEGTA